MNLRIIPEKRCEIYQLNRQILVNVRIHKYWKRGKGPNCGFLCHLTEIDIIKKRHFRSHPILEWRQMINGFATAEKNSIHYIVSITSWTRSNGMEKATKPLGKRLKVAESEFQWL